MKRTSLLALVGFLSIVVLSGCLPAQTSAGRATPVRRVLLLGDSITYGLYGTTPQVHGPLGRLMADRGVALTVDGFPGETPIDSWPGNPSWLDRMRWWVAVEDPDMIIIQSVLMPDADHPVRQAIYLEVMRQMLDVAQSRGAHVYLVSHPIPPGAAEQQASEVAQSLQADAVAGRGIATIPLDFWLDRCAGAYVADGWHLSAQGQDCHALAVALSVDQLRAVNG